MTADPRQLPGQHGTRATTRDRHEPIRQNATGEPPTLDKALEYRCRQVTASLREALGPDGSSALLARALTECEPRHPVLTHIRGGDGREIQLEGVSAGIAQFGAEATQAGVEAMIASLLGILGKLIGEDMALRLLDLDAGESSQNQDTP